MSDENDPKQEKQKLRREAMKKARREQYLKAKEKFKNSDFAKQMKEKQKELRREAYKKAKEKARQQKKTQDHDSDDTWNVLPQKKPKLLKSIDKTEKDKQLWDQLIPATEVKRVQLRLIKNDD
ncbi:MAG: hypothetical protein ACOH5I_20855 [Oligoflexus sp.]